LILRCKNLIHDIYTIFIHRSVHIHIFYGWIKSDFCSIFNGCIVSHPLFESTKATGSSGYSGVHVLLSHVLQYSSFVEAMDKLRLEHSMFCASLVRNGTTVLRIRRNSEECFLGLEFSREIWFRFLPIK
jgi:hypothetical protein